MTLCLTRAELEELAHRRRPSAIRRWLDQQGVRYMLDADGWPQVLRAPLVDRLGASGQTVRPRLRLA